ncbi:hypothetical protein QHF85_35085, partial [Polyangium sp. 6x1]|nr:hypothetical protein [Polyangium sp. 6x1]
MSETPPRGIEDSTATQTSNGIDGPPPGVSGVAGAAGSVDGAAPRPLPPRPGGSVPAPPRPSRVPVSGSSPPPRPNTNMPPRASNPPAASVSPAVPAPPAVPQIETPTETLPALAAEPERAAPPPLPRRRSRRTVKTEDDTMPASEGQVALPDDAATPAPEPVAEAAPPPEPLPAMDAGDAGVIQPMRILSVGEDLPPVKVYSEPPPAMPAAEATSKPRRSTVPPARPAEDVVEEGWTPRPPEVAAITAQFASEQAQTVAFAPPPAVPRPPMDTPVTPIEARETAPRTKPLESAPELVVEVAEEEADDDVVSAVAEEARADEVDAFEEIEPERVSEGARKASATTDAQQAAAPKKPPPPPPPPRRQAPTVPDPGVVPTASTSLPPPKAPPPPPASAQATPPP